MYFTVVPLIYVNNIDICQLIQYLSFKFLFNQKHFLLSFFLIKTHFRIILEFTSKTLSFKFLFNQNPFPHYFRIYIKNTFSHDFRIYIKTPFRMILKLDSEYFQINKNINIYIFLLTFFSLSIGNYNQSLLYKIDTSKNGNRQLLDTWFSQALIYKYIILCDFSVYYYYLYF